MIDRRLFLGLALLAATAAQAAVQPQNTAFALEPEAIVRLFARQERLQYFAEGDLRSDAAGAPSGGKTLYNSFTLGGYARILRELRAGLFFKQQRGLRHDDDWVKENGAWQWVDTSGRAENFGIIDVTPRFDLGRHWVGELKARYHYNFTFQNQQLLSVRPGLFYFWMTDGEDPILNLFAQVELWMPLNYGVKPVNEFWVYAGALRPVSPNVLIGGYAAFRTMYWGPSSDFRALDPGTSYVSTSRSAVLSLMAVFQFDLAEP